MQDASSRIVLQLPAKYTAVADMCSTVQVQACGVHPRVLWCDPPVMLEGLQEQVPFFVLQQTEVKDLQECLHRALVLLLLARQLSYYGCLQPSASSACMHPRECAESAEKLPASCDSLTESSTCVHSGIPRLAVKHFKTEIATAGEEALVIILTVVAAMRAMRAMRASLCLGCCNRLNADEPGYSHHTWRAQL